MARKQVQFILKHYLADRRTGKKAGFTLPELLVAMVVGSIVVSGMLFLVANLLETDKKENAKSTTQQEMAQAMDYMASEVQEAVYIYEGECLGTGRVGTAPGVTPVIEACPGLKNNLVFPANTTPVLAFWKFDPVEGDELPNNCLAVGQEECKKLLTTLNTYTLVVYSVQTAPATTWEGDAQITRFELKQYKTLDPLEATDNFGSAPAPPNFFGWQPSAPIAVATAAGRQYDVLVDWVDKPRADLPPSSCPTGYTQTPTTTPPNNFYACVKPGGGDTIQDAIVFLRGNALKRAGQDPANNNYRYLPSLERRVQARSVFNRTPQL